jgi:hypothetical protein
VTLQSAEQRFAVGDRVELLSSSNSAPGSIVSVTRGKAGVSKCAVKFDDMPGATWILRPTSLQRVSDSPVKPNCPGGTR